MKLYRFENDFGNTCGTYFGFVMANSEVEARELFILEMNRECNLEINVKNYMKLTPTHVSDKPDCHIVYSE